MPTVACGAGEGYDVDSMFQTLWDTTSTTSGTDTETPTTGPTSGPASTTDAGATSSTTDQHPATTTAGGDDVGCGCRQGPSSPVWLVWLLAAGLLPQRSAALVLCVGALGGVGCSSKENHNTEATGPSTEEPSTTGAGSTADTTAGTDTMTGAGTTSSPVLARLFGTFHPQPYTDGQKWQQGPNGEDLPVWWGNLTIEADSTLSYEFYSCGKSSGVQSFSWEADGDSIRVVPLDVPFKWGGSELVEITIKPGEICGEILLTSVTPDDQSFTSTWDPGHLCGINSQQDACVFEFKWCESPPEPPVCG